MNREYRKQRIISKKREIRNVYVEAKKRKQRAKQSVHTKDTEDNPIGEENKMERRF